MKITTLIPAFKPKYLADLVLSLRAQAVKPARIILSDDSPDQAFVGAFRESSLARTAQELNLGVIAGPRSGGAFANIRQLLDAWNGETELFHILLDDDILYPSFYERHLAAHGSNRFPCTISRRWTANEAGFPVAQLALPRTIFGHGQRLLAVDATALFSSTLPPCHNWLGEFSNAVWRREHAPTIVQHSLEAISYYGLIDIGAFLSASAHGPLGFINEALGAFRMGPHQHTADVLSRNVKLSHLAWMALAIAGQRAGRLSAPQALQCFTRMGDLFISRYRAQPDVAQFCAILPALLTNTRESEERFLEAWSEYIREPGAGA